MFACVIRGLTARKNKKKTINLKSQRQNQDTSIQVARGLQTQLSSHAPAHINMLISIRRDLVQR